MRQALVRFHRLVVPMREAVSGLMRREHAAVERDLYPYYQDVYDHVLRVSESTDALRDLVSTIVETNLSLRDYRQNQVDEEGHELGRDHRGADAHHRLVRHERPYPASATLGVIVSALLMVLGSVGLYVAFKRKDWL